MRPVRVGCAEDSGLGNGGRYTQMPRIVWLEVPIDGLSVGKAMLSGEKSSVSMG